jgi:hypothetical protein
MSSRNAIALFCSIGILSEISILRPQHPEFRRSDATFRIAAYWLFTALEMFERRQSVVKAAPKKHDIDDDDPSKPLAIPRRSRAITTIIPLVGQTDGTKGYAVMGVLLRSSLAFFDVPQRQHHRTAVRKLASRSSPAWVHAAGCAVGEYLLLDGSTPLVWEASPICCAWMLDHVIALLLILALSPLARF